MKNLDSQKILGKVQNPQIEFESICQWWNEICWNFFVDLFYKGIKFCFLW